MMTMGIEMSRLLPSPVVRRWLLALALMVASVPGPALAQIPPSAPDERPMLQIGPVEIRPRLIFTNMGIDNNVFNEHENPRSDFTFTASPDLELAINPGRLRTQFTIGSDFVYFKKYTSERSVNRSFSAQGELDLTYFRPFASVAANHTSTRVSSEIDERGRHHPRAYTAGSIFKLTPRSALTFTYRRASERFDEETFFRGVDLSTTLNSDTNVYEASLGLELTPLTSVRVGISSEQMRFKAPGRDSDTFRVMPTIVFSPLGVLQGSASVGYRRFTGRDNGFENYSGLVAAGSLGASVADRFKLETTFRRDVMYSYEERFPYYVQSGGRGSVTTLLAGGFDVKVSGGHEALNYRAFPGSAETGRDTVVTYGVGLGYQIAARARFVVEAEFINRASPRDISREYSNRRFFATLNWGASIR